ncbi:CAP domain-containing protein [Halobacillus shinanisalinarum]|uniref:CAP domain-containing protein n=1 Tax=Halobacillus shinanisalinarum TaxID=2932258 RepID=A0ABY4GYU9_9BACI|nr:CAP domain-containing protein [Halobacillus shinanisalinarum]UOQ93059.1 CAP domain-containing protein [Halobacillus shinanisalinarum]
MGKKVMGLLLFVLLCGVIYFMIDAISTRETVKKDQETSKEPIKQENLAKDQTNLQSSFVKWLGVSSEEVLAEFGEPERIDKSSYGYDWWVYPKEGQYFQLGIKDDTVVTSVTYDQDLNESLKIGESYNRLNQEYAFQNEFPLKDGMFSFELTVKDLSERPLIALNDQWSAQLYFDTFTDKLSAIRAIRNDILLMLQPYQLNYRGELPQGPILTEEDWREINEGSEQQIYEMTNNIRASHDIDKLKKHKEAATVAFGHSKDMNQNNYFSHHSQNGNGVGERLRLGNVPFVRAGENIAAQYIDATAAIHGWLNSEGHRASLLDKRYTHIGVGVDQLYYTQNFLSLP